MIWYILGGIALLVAVAVVLVGGLIGYIFVRDAIKEKKVRQHGRPVLASLVMCNQTLFQPDGDPMAPGVVVFSNDPPSTELAANLKSIAGHVYPFYTADEATVARLSPAEQMVARTLKDHNYREGRRTRLPAEVAGRDGVWMADLFIDRDRLPANWQEHRTLACMATGDDVGQIILLKLDEEDAARVYNAAQVKE